MKKIEKLTATQEADLARAYESALAFGRSTEPADKPTAEAAIAGMYARLGKPRPIFVWVDSPMAVCLTGAWLETLMKNSQLWSQLESQLRSQLWSQLRSQLESQLWSQLRSQLGSQLGLMFIGQHQLGWPTFYDFAGQIGVKYKPKDIEALSWWIRIGQSACWWQPRNGIVTLSDRAAELHLDSDGRMHNRAGAAMKFRDGYGVWSISGVLVDEQIVMTPETQTLEQIKKEVNAEKKRIRIERFGGRESDQVDGWKRYLGEIGAKVVETRQNDIDGTQEGLVATPDGMALALVACRSTGRRYALEVPPEIKSCEQAQNWMRSGSWLDGVKGLKRRTIDAA